MKKMFTQLKNHFLPVALAMLIFAVAAGAVQNLSFAQVDDETKSATSSSNSAVNIDLIKQRLQKSQVMGRQAGDKKHALVGKIVRVTREAITIEITDGDTSIFPLSEILLLNQNEQAVNVDSVAIDSWATVLGYMSDDQNFEPMYILVAGESLQPKSQFISIGSISAITTKLLTIAPRNDPSGSVEISLVKATTFQNSVGEELTLKDFETDMQVLVVGLNGANDSIEGVTVRSLVPVDLTDE
jgi:hypothetical protein